MEKKRKRTWFYVILYGTCALFGLLALFGLVITLSQKHKVPQGEYFSYGMSSIGVSRIGWGERLSNMVYEYEVDGEVITQPVIDWVGESPMDGILFTYTVEFDSNRLHSGDRLRLIEVKKGRVEWNEDAPKVGFPFIPALYKKSPASLAKPGTFSIFDLQFTIFGSPFLGGKSAEI